MARLEEAEIAPRLSRFAMDAMLTALGGSFAGFLGGNPDRLRMHVEPGVGMVVADEEMLSRILGESPASLDAEELPVALVDLVDGLLQKDRDLRIGNA